MKNRRRKSFRLPWDGQNIYNTYWTSVQCLLVKDISSENLLPKVGVGEGIIIGISFPGTQYFPY